MSYVKLNTTKELQKFLKIVASEAVKKSLNESNDEYVDSYEKSFNQDKKTYYTAKTFYEICNIEDKTLEQIRHQYKTYKYSGNFKTKFNKHVDKHI